MKFKSIKIICMLICICLFSLFGKEVSEAYPSSAKINEQPVIILDAGHGGFDGGAVANDGTVEKDINLKICTFVSEFSYPAGAFIFSETA